MADQNCSPDMCFKDAVCIDTGRVYDSCCNSSVVVITIDNFFILYGLGHIK